MSRRITTALTRSYIQSDLQNEIRKAIKDREVRKIKVSIGSIDQFVDSTDIMTEPRLYRRLRTMFVDD